MVVIHAGVNLVEEVHPFVNGLDFIHLVLINRSLRRDEELQVLELLELSVAVSYVFDCLIFVIGCGIIRLVLILHDNQTWLSSQILDILIISFAILELQLLQYLCIVLAIVVVVEISEFATVKIEKLHHIVNPFALVLEVELGLVAVHLVLDLGADVRQQVFRLLQK